MATSIEIWKSLAGTDPGDFSLLVAGLDDSAGSFSYIDTLPSGVIAFYKARRYAATIDQYSDFSLILALSGPYPQGDTMLPPNTTQSGISTLLGISVESAPGVAAKANRLLEHVDGTMVATHEKLERSAIHNHPGTPGHVMGVSTVDGSFDLEVTPESMSEVFCALAGAPVTAAVTAPAAPAAPTVVVEGAAGATNYSYTIVASNAQGDSAASAATAITTGNAALTGVNYNQVSWLPVEGALYYKVLRGGAVAGTVYGLSFNDTAMATTAYVAPAGPTGNKSLWNAGLNQSTVTLTELQGNVYQVTAGCVAKSMAIEYDKTQKTPLKCKVDFDGLWQNRGCTASQLGLATAGYDPLGGFGVAPSVACLIGGLIASVAKAAWTVDRNPGQKQILSGFTAPHGHYLQGAKHKLALTLYFDTDAEMQAYFGQVAQTGVYGQTPGVLYYPIETIATLPVNGGGIVNQLGIWAPYATYTKVGIAIKGKEAIMQDIEIAADIDPVTGYDIAWYMVNSQSNSTIITPGASITGVNAGSMFNYSN